MTEATLTTIARERRDAARECIELRERHAESLRDLRLIESQMMRDIADDVAENGKPRFSNEASRNAELETRLAVNPNAIDLRKLIAGDEHASARAPRAHREQRRSPRARAEALAPSREDRLHTMFHDFGGEDRD